MCFNSGELIRSQEPAEQCVTVKVTRSAPVCNVTLVTLKPKASLLSCHVQVFGTAEIMTETLLCSLSLNYSMKSYLEQVNVLLQNNWRAIGHTSGKDGERIQERWKSKALWKLLHLHFFVCIIQMISSKDPINPWDEPSPPHSGTLICACDEGDGVRCFYPELSPWGSCRSVPRRGSCNSIFRKKSLGKDVAGGTRVSM